MGVLKLNSHFRESPKTIILLIEAAAVFRYFCFKQIFVPTFEESEGVLTRGVVFSFSQS